MAPRTLKLNCAPEQIFSPRRWTAFVELIGKREAAIERLSWGADGWHEHMRLLAIDSGGPMKDQARREQTQHRAKEALLDELRQSLREGWAVLNGIMGVQPYKLPAVLADELQPNFTQNTARCRGAVITEVTITLSARPPVDVETIAEWLKANRTDPPTTKERLREIALKTYPTTRTVDFNKAYSIEYKREPGRPKLPRPHR